MSWNETQRPIPVRTSSPGAYRPEARPVSALQTNAVLRNTYWLLSLTLLFSAGMAAMSMAMRVPPLHWAVMLGGMFGLLFLTHATRNSAWGLLSVFAFTGFIGFATGPVITAYLTAFSNGAELVMMAAGGTGAIFLGLSAYALTTKRDFSGMGKFLFIGLMVIVIASIANIFLNISGLALAVSTAAIAIFSGLILYDTQRIVQGGETNYISATVGLYLSVYNLFMSLLQLGGFLGGED
ncbi:Bax inhibitor-1/YccA family protein [Flagellatimonas centrodinii]|uniref:Bax inhibitor-1/YccA family protein n=1 Tax=Flagellatimonas centrodinii TaxID=2806210 RepID=UPI001FFC3D64|nr:Bax inhibitor-1/YccA family protein [Flagellatimonas centrodinii]ULQ46858.1 Bax inhibitor-1/YccA family protein [Flagellatimonas centrodinii]